MSPLLTCRITGEPKPKGSPRPLKLGNGRTIFTIHQSESSASWEHACTLELARAWAGKPPVDGPVLVRALWLLRRPRTVRRAIPTGRPDKDKLMRSLGDALQAAGVLRDDGQISASAEGRVYADAAPPGLWVWIEPIATAAEVCAVVHGHSPYVHVEMTP